MPLGENHMAMSEPTPDIRLDLGGGHAPAPGHINIDIVPEADIIWDLNKGLPVARVSELMSRDPKYIKVDSVKGVRCHHVIEHLDTIIPLMNDCYEVMKEGALFELSTPMAGSIQFWQDPTHKKGYVPESFLYFCEGSPFGKEQKEYGITARFKILKNRMGKRGDNWQLIVNLKK